MRRRGKSYGDKDLTVQILFFFCELYGCVPDGRQETCPPHPRPLDSTLPMAQLGTTLNCRVISFLGIKELSLIS